MSARSNERHDGPCIDAVLCRSGQGMPRCNHKVRQHGPLAIPLANGAAHADDIDEFQRQAPKIVAAQAPGRSRPHAVSMTRGKELRKFLRRDAFQQSRPTLVERVDEQPAASGLPCQAERVAKRRSPGGVRIGTGAAIRLSPAR